MPFWARVLEAFTFALPVLSGTLMLYSSASSALGMRDSGLKAGELRLGPAGPIARGGLLLASALSVIYLRRASGTCTGSAGARSAGWASCTGWAWRRSSRCSTPRSSSPPVGVPASPPRRRSRGSSRCASGAATSRARK